jgi:hypothetical protein
MVQIQIAKTSTGIQINTTYMDTKKGRFNKINYVRLLCLIPSLVASSFNELVLCTKKDDLTKSNMLDYFYLWFCL